MAESNVNKQRKHIEIANKRKQIKNIPLNPEKMIT